MLVDDRIALISEMVQHRQLFDVMKMQPGGRFIQDVGVLPVSRLLSSWTVLPVGLRPRQRRSSLSEADVGEPHIN